MNIIKKMMETIIKEELDGASTLIMYHPTLPKELEDYEKEIQKDCGKTNRQ